MKITLSIVVVLIVIFGGFFLLRGGTNDMMDEEMMEEGEEMMEDLGESMMETEETKTVTYTSSGFTPKTLEIGLGETVRFVNESGGKMWVASGIHPTHALYPEKSADDCFGSSFDQCETGTSWEFTFNETGSHGYHNHVQTNRSGTIIVK